MKGRCNSPAKSRPGEKNGMAKLTWEIVDEIRGSKGIISGAEWSRRLGIHQVHIYYIRSGRRWPPEKHP